ncbi:hypothetical protein J437_LFUL008435 [Ladona fulva]|uniref:CTNNB1 binding N-teminal domain-containing protein n=1 Tax=Ladona fulva TaxID=123851 RepID=A0A8K0P1E7_LADFU|nr:hypothetical protein J437_LFUL008435 [Ladona fulva]
MPHVSSGGGGDDLGSTDEVKVFKDEGEDEKRSSENLTEEKSSLIDLTESERCMLSKMCELSGGGIAWASNAAARYHVEGSFWGGLAPVTCPIGSLSLTKELVPVRGKHAAFVLIYSKAYLWMLVLVYSLFLSSIPKGPLSSIQRVY